MPDARLSLIEFPADDFPRAQRFWEGVLGEPLLPRSASEGTGHQSGGEGTPVGLHERGRGPGDRFSLPYFAVADVSAALERVRALGGEVVHPGEAWAVCRDSEGTPFGLARATSA